MAAGANVALATRPAVRSSPPAASAGTSATSGPMRTRRLLPAGATRGDRGADAVEGRVGRRRPRRSRRPTGGRPRPTAPSGPATARMTAPVLEDHLGQAAPHRRADAGHEVAADEAGDEGVRRRGEQPGGRARSGGSARPRSRPTRSASAVASSKSWVTSSGGQAQLARGGRTARRAPGARVWASSAESGSSKSRTAGSLASARARPDALALAARERAAAARSARWAMPNRSSSSSARAAPGEGHVLAHGHVREQRVLLEHVAHPARLGGQVDAPRGVEERRVAERDPAGARAAPRRRSPAAPSSCPRPEGPTRATVSPSPTSSATPSSKWRSGTAMSSRRTATRGSASARGGRPR